VTIAGTVVHVIAPSPAGGAESVVVALAATDSRRTRVAALNQVADAFAPAHPLVEQLRARGVVAEEVRCGRRRYRAEVGALAALLRAWNAGLVHTHGYHGTWVGYHAAKRAGTPVVATVHGYLTRSLKERLYNHLDRRLLRRFHAVIAVSRPIHDQLVASGVDPRRVHLVQNGMSPAQTLDRAGAREVLGLQPHARVIGWVGRLSPEKGPDLFLHALASLDRDAQAVIIGDGPELASLRILAERLRLTPDRLRFAGQQADAARLLPAFDALALTSRMEGTPMVVLEAVAAGVPVVTFEVGGIPGLLDRDSAWMVPAGDVAALGAALNRAVAPGSDGTARARHARERLQETLSPERWRDRVWQVYDRATDPRTSSIA
jgi:glycosyltransferase involved in cell wall biosynthesis